MAAEKRSKFDAATSRLKLAYAKSHRSFMEEAEDILRSTLASSSTAAAAGTSSGTEGMT